MVMKYGLRLSLAVALTVLFLPGCAFLQEREQKRKEKRRAAEERRLAGLPKVPLFVGTITLVNADEGFALIDSGSSPSPPAGTVITSRTAGLDSGELRVTEVRRHPFAIADIVKGKPHKGDAAFQ